MSLEWYSRRVVQSSVLGMALYFSFTISNNSAGFPELRPISIGDLEDTVLFKEMRKKSSFIVEVLNILARLVVLY